MRRPGAQTWIPASGDRDEFLDPTALQSHKPTLSPLRPSSLLPLQSEAAAGHTRHLPPSLSSSYPPCSQKRLQDTVDASRKMNEGLDAKLLKLTAAHADLQSTFGSMAAQQTAGQAKGKIEVRQGATRGTAAQAESHGFQGRLKARSSWILTVAWRQLPLCIKGGVEE